MTWKILTQDLFSGPSKNWLKRLHKRYIAKHRNPKRSTLREPRHVRANQAGDSYLQPSLLRNADERRENDCFWNPAYTFVTAPLVRTMIDVLDNITFILEGPATNGAAFRQSGFRKELSDLNEDQTRYGGQRKWDAYIERKTKGLDLAIRSSGLNKSDILQQQPWKTLGKYLSEKGTGAALTPHQAFLKTFTYGMWREY
jgi:hypothetical protein